MTAAVEATEQAGSAEQARSAEESESAGLLGLLQQRFESPQARGRVFERVMAEAFRRHPHEYGPQRFKRVWRWVEWPDRGRHGFGGVGDVGIDLVAEQTEAAGGGLCAIQTKAHAGGRIDKAAVDSFISASASMAFSSRLLAVTAPLTMQAQRMVRNASPRCEVLHGSDIDAWPVDWADCIEDPSRLRFSPAERHTPKPFQAEAVRSVVEGLADCDRGRLILPCGTGKSVVSLWIAEQLAGRGGRVLYLVPSIALMDQTMREWARQQHPDIRHRYMGVCSDTKVGRTEEDAALAELAMPVTTDPSSIRRSLASEHPEHMTVVFCTYQSLSLIADAQAGARTGTRTGAQTGAQAATQTDTQASAQAGIRADTQTSAQTDTQANPRTDTQTDTPADARADTQTAARAGARADTQTDARAGARADTQTSAQAGIRAGTQSDARAGVQTGVHVDVLAGGGVLNAVPRFDLVVCDEAHRTTGIDETPPPAKTEVC